MMPATDGLAGLVLTQIWQVTVVAAFAAVIAGLFCRTRPRLAYLLGIVVLVKCWVPPTWSSPIGVFSWPGREGKPAVTAQTSVRRVAATDRPPTIESTNEPAPRAGEPVDVQAASLRFDDSSPEPPDVSLAVGLVGVWLAGALGLVAFGLFQDWRWRTGLRPLISPPDGSLGSLTTELAGRLGLRRRPRVMISTTSVGPAVFGLLRPTIVLPAQLVAQPIEDQLTIVLAHEMTHIRRGDLVAGIFQWITQIVWWFHPLIWLTSRQLTRERERCCDEDVLATLRCPPASYAQCLLDVLRMSRGLPLLPAFPGVRAVDVTRRRLEHILRCPTDGQGRTPPRHWLLAVAFLVVVLPGAPLMRAAPADRQAADRSAGAVNNESSKAEQQEDGDAGDPEKHKAAPGAASPGTGTDKKPEGDVDHAERPKSHPIDLKGMAVGPDGKPIAGAKIYVASLRADWKRLAETVTDDDGRYEFHDVLLPIERATTNTGRDAGSFEVFGQAKGFGFAWQPQKWYYPERREADALRDRTAGIPRSFEADDEIALDLTFSTPASLSGRIVDEKGRAIPGARLAVRYCEPLGVQPGTMTFGFSALNQQQDVPLEMKLRTTDAEGKFTFTDLPKDCLFRIDVRPRDFPSRWVYAATTGEPQPDYQQSPVLTGDLKLTFVTPIEVPLQVVYDDTGTPAAKVLVSGGNREAGSSMTSDANGRGTLRLPPGEYHLELLPARGTPYLVTNEELIVGARQVAEPRIARLRAAGVLEITVEDEETGEGLPDIDLWWEMAAPVPANQPRSRELLYFRSFEAETRICRFERPRTDVNGKMRALVEPGKHVVGVGFEAYPSGYAFPSGAANVECEPGETVEITFKVRKRLAPADDPTPKTAAADKRHLAALPQLRQAIERGVNFLKAEQQADGHWPDPVGYPGGITSLCTLALVRSGVKPDEVCVQLGVAHLRPLRPRRTYSTALQTMVFCAVDPTIDQKRIQRNVDWLCEQQKTQGPFTGAWAYPESEGDNSNTGFAVLALYEAEQVGVKIPPAVWRRTLDHWVKSQNADGSWGYKPQVRGTGSMTAQGLFCVAAATKLLDEQQPDQPGPKAIERATAWMASNFSAVANPGSRGAQGWLFYYLHAVAKAGRATNKQTLGDHDWFAEGSQQLLAMQQPDGSWKGTGHAEDDPHLATGLALLFLAHGAKQAQ